MRTFENFPQAFDYCRHQDKPITAMVGTEKWKLFPSGKATKVNEWRKFGTEHDKYIDKQSTSAFVK